MPRRPPHRGTCEFNCCGCAEFTPQIHRCAGCGHGDVWHRRPDQPAARSVAPPRSRPPTDGELQFRSPRALVRRPVYTSAPGDERYCACVEDLPA